MKKALYIADYKSDAETLRVLTQLFGRDWEITELRYGRNNPIGSVCDAGIQGAKFDLVIGHGLGGYIALAAQCDTMKIAINPYWDMPAVLSKYGVCAPDAYEWAACQQWIWRRPSSKVLCVFGNDEDCVVSHSDVFARAFENVMFSDNFGHSITEESSEALKDLFKDFI